MTPDLDRDPPHEEIQVLLVSGSVRKPSRTRTLTDCVERTLWNRGAVTINWNLGERPLPIADPEYHDDPARHTDEAVQELVALADICDAIVLSSPIYHNSYSGVLKNALDNLSIAQFQYKPVGLLSHGGNRSLQAVDHLRIVVRGLLGVAIPTQVCTGKQDYRSAGIDAYSLESEDVLHRIEHFAGELVFFALQLRAARRTTATAAQ